MLNPDMDNRNASLRWMVYEAVAAGLRMDVLEGWTKDKKVVLEVHESLTWVWWPLELLCVKHLSYEGRRDTKRP